VQLDTDAIEIGHDVIIGEADDLISGGGQHCVADFVARGGFVGEMGVAVDLDGELGMVAGEVEDIGAQRDLPAEMETQGTKLAEKLPETTLRLGWIIANGARAAGHLGSTRMIGQAPLPVGPPPTLALPSRGRGRIGALKRQF
jgi:hypothetical protein